MPTLSLPTENLVLLIPCYNCGNAVRDVVDACKAFSHRILLVNDGSTDETTRIIQQLDCATLGWKRNQGKGIALREGFRYWLAKNDWEVLITLDSDGQHDPKEIRSLLDVYHTQNPALVLGTRQFNRSQTPAVRYWSNTMSSALISWITGCPVRDLQCGYRLFSRDPLIQMLPTLTSNAYSIETEMALTAFRLGFTMAEAPVSAIYLPGATARSSWKPLRDSGYIAGVVMRHLITVSRRRDGR